MMKRDIIREKILTSAESVFERHGYDKTTLEDLGREAGLNKTSLYYYYPNKEEIFSAVIQRQVDAFLVALDNKINKKKNGKNGLRSYLENRNSILKKFSLLHKHKHVLNASIADSIDEKETEFVKQLILTGIENKELRKNTEKGAKVLLAALNAVQSAKELELLCEFLWDGMAKRKKDIEPIIN